MALGRPRPRAARRASRTQPRSRRQDRRLEELPPGRRVQRVHRSCLLNRFAGPVSRPVPPAGLPAATGWNGRRAGGLNGRGAARSTKSLSITPCLPFRFLHQKRSRSGRLLQERAWWRRVGFGPSRGQWNFAWDKNRLGPFSAAQLRELAEQGKLQPQDTVWKEGVEKGVAAEKVKSLFPPVPVPAAAPSCWCVTSSSHWTALLSWCPRAEAISASRFCGAFPRA